MAYKPTTKDHMWDAYLEAFLESNFHPEKAILVEGYIKTRFEKWYNEHYGSKNT